jgi:hypothetical protein
MKMNDYTFGQFIELCQSVFRGCKPCAMMPLKKRDLDEALFFCNDEGCYSKTNKIDGEWVEFWIFKRMEIEKIIELIPEEPKTPLDHYLLGALFGYSNDAICDFIKKEFPPIY